MILKALIFRSKNSQSILGPKYKRSNYANEPNRNKVKIHISWSESMRQTQYNKLVSEINKFDVERIKKAIKEGKIQNLIQKEQDNPNINKVLSKFKRNKIQKIKRHIDSPDDEKIIQARKRKNDFISKKMMQNTVDVNYIRSKNSKSKNAKNFNVKSKIQNSPKKEIITPFELRTIKERLSLDSYRIKNNLSMPRIRNSNLYQTTEEPPQSSSSKLSSLSRMQMSNFISRKKLSPRLEEFWNIKKDQISQILADSENQIKDISEYPDRYYNRIREQSFENIPSPVKQSVQFVNDFEAERSVSSLASYLPREMDNPSTYHFKIDINKNNVAFKRHLHYDDELGMDPVDKTLKIGRNAKNLFLDHVNDPFDEISYRPHKFSKFS